jgi:outer membrane protein insertion porin family
LPDSAYGPRMGFLDREGSVFNNFTVRAMWNRNTFNRGMFPTAGSGQSLSLDVAVPGSGLQYYKLRYFNEMYFPISGEWVVHLRNDLGFGDGYGSTQQLPFFEHFYAGGLGSIRGFERLSLGPRATNAEQYLTSFSRFVRDDNGDIALDRFGNPIPDPLAAPAYVMEQRLDENGNPLFDAQGNPIYSQVIQRQRSFGGFLLPFGGNIQVVSTLELLFPLPLIEDRSRMRSAVFFDAGNVFSSYCTEVQRLASNCSKFSLDEFRYSAGVSVSWLSGFGLMTFSLARPFNASPIDRRESFQFTIGNTF